MKLNLLFSILLLVLWPTTLVAQPWVPVPCADRLSEIKDLTGVPDLQASWHEFEQAVRSSKPGSSGYTPHPFPTTRVEILENFEYAMDAIIIGRTDVEDMPSGVGAIQQARSRGELTFEILRVVNWDLDRCSTRRPVNFSHLLRLYDASTRELGRVIIHDSGLWGRLSLRPETAFGEDWESTIPPLDGLADWLAERFDFKGPVVKPQYVNLRGLFYCTRTLPCVAFRSQGRMYVLDGARLLYELSQGAPRSVTAQRKNVEPRETLLQPEWDRPLVTVGFGWSEARRVAGSIPSSAHSQRNR